MGALTVGKATPYLVHAIPNAGPSAVILTASACAVVARCSDRGLYRDGPIRFRRGPFSWSLVRTVFAEREWRLATGGYLGHMFELYSFWTWIPSFIARERRRVKAVARGAHTDARVSLIAFGTIAIGGLGCVWGGLAADRRGRERLVILAMALSGSCALLIPFVFGRSLWCWLRSRGRGDSSSSPTRRNSVRS